MILSNIYLKKHSIRIAFIKMERVNDNLINAIEIPNNYNTRHFGSYTTNDGRILMKQKLIRSGSPTGFKDEDVQILLNTYNLKKVIDFRTAAETEAEPSLSNVPGVSYIRMGMLDEIINDDQKKLVAGKNENKLYEILQSTNAAKDRVEEIIEYYGKVYVGILQNEHSRNIMRRFFDSLLGNEDGCILFHCAGGKDRTGMAAALFLKVIGVDWDTCLKDYLLTNVFFAKEIETTLNEIKENTEDPEVLESVRLAISADLRFLDSALKYINNEYGSLDNYISDALLLTEDKIKKLRALYTI